MKIIAFSVNNEKFWKRTMLKAGADYYLTKDVKSDGPAQGNSACMQWAKLKLYR